MRNPFLLFAFSAACDFHPAPGEYAVGSAELVEDTCSAFGDAFEAEAFTEAGFWVSERPEPNGYTLALGDPPLLRWQCEVVRRRLRCSPRGENTYAPDFRLYIAYLLDGRFRADGDLEFEYRIRTECEGNVCAPSGLGPECEARVTGTATPVE